MRNLNSSTPTRIAGSAGDGLSAKRSLFGKMVATLALAGLATSASAINLYWTGSGGATNAPVSGSWELLTSGYWSDGASSTGNAGWTNANTAIFGGTDGTYDITVPGHIGTVNTIFNNSGYTLSSGSPVIISNTSSSGAVTVAAGKTATIGANVTMRVTANPALFNSGLTASGTLIIENGGTYNQPNNQPLNLDGAPGSKIRVMTGGTLSQGTGTAGSNVRIGITSNASPELSIEGGTVTITSPATLILGAGGGSTGIVTMASGTLTVPSTGGNSIRLTEGAATSVGIFNLNGGTASMRNVAKGSGLGTFNFNGGTLKAHNSGAAAAFMTGLTTANVRNGGGTIDNSGFNLTVAQVLVHSTIAGDNATDGGLTSIGNGSLTLTGANTYNGPTTVSAGKLVTTTASIGGGSYSVADGATLEVQVAGAGQSLTNSSLTLGTGGNVTNNFTLGANASTTVPAVRVNGALNLNSTVSVTVTGTGLTGPNTYLLMSYGLISGSGSFVANALPSVPGYVATLTNDTVAKQLKLVYAAAPQPVKWAVGNDNWDTTTANWNPLSGGGPTTYVEGSVAVFDETASGSSPITVTLAANRTPSWITNISTKNYILAGSFDITGSPGLTKAGGGTLVLANGAGNVFGSVEINGGTLQLGNGDTGGSLGSGVISNNATLAFNRTDGVSIGNVIAGTGNLVQNGGGSVTLSSASTHTGVTAINAGQLLLGNSAALQNSTVSNNVPNGLGFVGITAATLGGLAGAADFSMLNDSSALVALTVGGNNQASTYSGSLSGTANLFKTGTNVLTLTGSSTINTIQTVSNGTLVIAGGSSSLNNLQLIADNSTVLITDGFVTVNSDSRISGANAVFGVSGGTLNLPKFTVGATATATNTLMIVSSNAVVNQNSAGGTSPINQLLVGGNNGGSGTLLLKDNASWNNISTLANAVMIGNVNAGQGVLTIQDNASFYNAQVMRVADLAANGGTVNLNGGNLQVNGFSRGAGTAFVNAGGGKITALAANANFFANFPGTGGTNSVNLLAGGLTMDTSAFDIGITNVLSGVGGLVKQGSSVLTLSASNTYTGPTRIEGGTLFLRGAGSINGSSSVVVSNFSTLDLTNSPTQLATPGALILSDSTLNIHLASTNIVAGSFGASGSGNTINIASLPTIATLPATIRVIDYSTALPGLVDGGNNLIALTATLPVLGSPQGYLTNNTVSGSIDLVITAMSLAPVIVVEPAPDSAYPGFKAHFQVQLEITNSAGLSYRWRKGGTPLNDGASIAGSTTPLLRLSNITGGDAGNYDVVITNNAGAITSAVAPLAVLAPTGFDAAAVTTGLQAFYTFEETSDPATNGAVAFDYAGDLDGVYGVAAQNGNPSYAVAGPLPADGYPFFSATNQAARFQGFTANSRVTIPALNLNTNSVTLAAWVRPNNTPANSGIIFCRGGGTVAGLNFLGSTDGFNNRHLGYTWNNEAGTYTWNPGLAVPDTQWSFVAVTITPTNATLYIINTNGLLAASQNYTHVNQSFNVSTFIGEDSSGGNRQMNGDVDGVAIYNRALTQSELQTIYSAASGVLDFPPTTVSQPASLTRYEHQTATFTAQASGSLPLSYRWKYFDGVSSYTDIVNGSRISGATSSTLVISNLALADAGNIVAVVTNLYGAATSSVATLTVNATVGPATNFTTSAIQASGSNWDTDGTWNMSGSATDLAGQYFGSTFTILAPGGLRTPDFGNPGTATSASFPGEVLRVEGNGTFDTSLNNAGAIRIKGGNPSTVYFKKLVMAGGQISSILNSGWSAILTGEINVLSNAVIWAADDTSPRSITIQSTLTGNGSIQYHAYNTFTNLQTSSSASLNIASANNPYTGTWFVELGTLVASGNNSLGTNTITVGAQGALQANYDINNPNGALILDGRLNLTRNHTFKSVTVNGTPLAAGTHSFVSLNAAYPTNFPATWTGVNGALTETAASGSITIPGGTASYPTNITFSVSGGAMTLSWPGTHLGWILQTQTNSRAVGLGTNWTDVAGSASVTTTNFPVAPANPTVFYRLRKP